MVGFNTSYEARLLKEHARVVSKGVVEFEEKNDSGKGVVRFQLDDQALQVIHNGKPPIKWARNQKCADGALVVCSGDDVILHVIELKRKVTSSSWSDIKQQFEGMVLNVRAMLAIVEHHQPTSIVCHIGYEEETISPEKNVDPSLLKIPLGKLADPPGALEWQNGRVAILGFNDIYLKKIIRVNENSEGLGDLIV